MNKYRIIIALLGILLFANSGILYATGRTDNSPDWFYPKWASTAKYNTPIKVLDTNSALGRYSDKPKELGLKDLARVHGHLCDGMVIAYIEIKAALEMLFPDGVVDRTDLRVVSKNGPCWVDTASMMSGARINFGTLSIDPKIGDGFIVQKISTGKAYDVHLKPGVFPEEQNILEKQIRKSRADGKPVTKQDIDTVENMANNLSKRLLNSEPSKTLDIKLLPDYKFEFKFSTAARGDIINKDMP